MLEVLKIIILACQVTSGSVVPAVVDRHQKKCQKELIKCVNYEKTHSPEGKLFQCILDRE